MSHLDDDGGPEVVAVESGDTPQALWVRVGPVFHEDEKDEEPGIWICYQNKHMSSNLLGPILLTPETWRTLDRAVRERLKHARSNKRGR